VPLNPIRAKLSEPLAGQARPECLLITLHGYSMQAAGLLNRLAGCAGFALPADRMGRLEDRKDPPHYQGWVEDGS
jgi:hypothetical protein